MKKRLFAAGSALALGTLILSNSFSALAADITKEKAQEIALEHAGVDAKDVSYIHTKTDYENRRKVYEVEFFTNDYKEYDYEIAVSDGTILKIDYDAERWDRNGRSASPSKAASQNEITQEEAQEIALKQAGISASQASYIRIHKDWDDGRSTYEGEMVYGDLEYEFEISASTGAILEWDIDSIYD